LCAAVFFSISTLPVFPVFHLILIPNIKVHDNSLPVLSQLERGTDFPLPTLGFSARIIRLLRYKAACLRTIQPEPYILLSWKGGAHPWLSAADIPIVNLCIYVFREGSE
jgi:hypothetical protein